MGAATRKKKRGLTEADRAVWRAYTVTVTPLPGRALPEPQPEAEARPAPVPPPSAPVTALPVAPPGRIAPPPELHVGAQPAGLDAKRWTALRRGRMRPERTLDLHGRRAQDAHGAVMAFIADALADGLRCVAVVTGKGSSPEGGVLRRELPHWLNAPELRRHILGAAHPHAANSGAVHLLLRRRR